MQEALRDAGFETGKHDISIDCGEQALLPAVREAADETIEQAGAGRRALHVAQVMKLARERGPQGYTTRQAGGGLLEAKPPAPRGLKRRRAAACAAVVGAPLAGAVMARRRA